MLNLFDLEKITVDDVMTAHTQVEVIDFDGSIDDIMARIASSYHTRLPVREGDKEEIIGFIHVRKVINQLRAHRLDAPINKEDLREILSEPYFVPSGTPLYTQIQQFQENQEPPTDPEAWCHTLPRKGATRTASKYAGHKTRDDWL